MRPLAPVWVGVGARSDTVGDADRSEADCCCDPAEDEEMPESVLRREGGTRAEAEGCCPRLGEGIFGMEFEGE